MKVKDLNPDQLLCIPCPTCGVGPRDPCLNHSGEERSESHLGRKLFAVEIVELKGFDQWNAKNTRNMMYSRVFTIGQSSETSYCIMSR